MFRILYNMYLFITDILSVLQYSLNNEIRIGNKFRINNRYTTITITDYEQCIPKIIHQTHESENLSLENYTASEIISQMNPEYIYKFYNSKQRKDYIKKNFGEESIIYKCYQKLKPNTYKSDLFRWCVLYIDGGIYIDCKSMTIVPFRNFIPPKSSMALFWDPYPRRISTGFLSSVPKNPIVKDMIDLIIFHTIFNIYGSNPLDVTGPLLISKIINESQYIIGKDLDIIGNRLLLCEHYCRSNEPLIQRYYKGFWGFQSITNRYEYKWIIGDIFEKN